MLTAQAFLLRGLLAGLIAGVLTFGVACVVGEGPIDAAITIEELGAAGEAHDHSAEAGTGAEAEAEAHDHGELSRQAQSTWGLATGTIVFSTALGGIVGLATAFAFGRMGRLRVQAAAGLVALLGFIAVYLVPFVKYPPNPPAVGHEDTIGSRTSMYFLVVLISAVAGIAAVVVARRLTPRLGAFNGGIVAGLGYVVVAVLAFLALPTFDEVPLGFPAGVLWDFRVASLGVQAVMWAAIGLVLGLLMQRAVAKMGRAGAPSTDLPAASTP